MPNQVDGALVRAPCPVPSCPACEPNSGSVHPNLPAKAARVERGRHCYEIMYPSLATGCRKRKMSFRAYRCLLEKYGQLVPKLSDKFDLR